MILSIFKIHSTLNKNFDQKNAPKKTITISFLFIGLLFLALQLSCSNANDVDLTDIVSISVTPATSTISIDGTQSFVAKGTKSDGSIVTITNSAIWTSSSLAVATVSTSGVAHGLIVGTSTITATSGSKSGVATLIVVNAQSLDPVLLGTAGDFVILSKTGITNGVAATLAITGNIGTSPITAAAMNTIPCENVVGAIFGVDATYSGGICFEASVANKTLVDTAVLDMEIAYADAAGRTLPDFTELGAGDISGMTLSPGLYKWGTGVLITNVGITLSGSANDVWIFQIGDDLTINNSANITMTGGAQAKNVFWQVSGQATIGTDVSFKGILLSLSLISVDTTAVVNGRLLAQTEVTLQGNIITEPN